jgi:hypothetical protein
MYSITMNLCIANCMLVLSDFLSFLWCSFFSQEISHLSNDVFHYIVVYRIYFILPILLDPSVSNVRKTYSQNFSAFPVG